MALALVRCPQPPVTVGDAGLEASTGHRTLPHSFILATCVFLLYLQSPLLESQGPCLLCF